MLEDLADTRLAVASETCELAPRDASTLAEARRAGLSAAIAEPVWRTLIARCIAHEFAVFDAKAKTSAA